MALNKSVHHQPTDICMTNSLHMFSVFRHLKALNKSVFREKVADMHTLLEMLRRSVQEQKAVATKTGIYIQKETTDFFKRTHFAVFFIHVCTRIHRALWQGEVRPNDHRNARDVQQAEL